MKLIHPNGVNEVNIDTPELIIAYKKHGYREQQTIPAEVIAHKELHFTKPELPKKVAAFIDEIDNYIENQSKEVDKAIEPLADSQPKIESEPEQEPKLGVKEKPKQTRKRKPRK